MSEYLNTFSNLPPLWKSILVITAILGVGFTVGGATYSFTGIPKLVAENTRQIEENRALITQFRQDQLRVFQELRKMNCIQVRALQDLRWEDCVVTVFE